MSDVIQKTKIGGFFFVKIVNFNIFSDMQREKIK
jgi:hypothetical protein